MSEEETDEKFVDSKQSCNTPLDLVSALIVVDVTGVEVEIVEDVEMLFSELKLVFWDRGSGG